MRGYSMEKQEYQQRLRRIEGQVRGLQRMIEEDAYCIDVITQVSSVTRALQAVALGLLDEHVRHCVADSLRNDTEGAEGAASRSKLDEAMAAVERLVRS